MAHVRVSCINKTDRQNAHERIRNLGGVHDSKTWKMTQAEVIQAIESRQHSFYVEQPPGHQVAVIVAVSRFGHKYVKTTADGEQPDNLLALPECP